MIEHMVMVSHHNQKAGSDVRYLIPSLLVHVVASSTFPISMFSGNCPQNFCTFTSQPLQSHQKQIYLQACKVQEVVRACHRSNISLQICLYPSPLKSTIL